MTTLGCKKQSPHLRRVVKVHSTSVTQQPTYTFNSWLRSSEWRGRSGNEDFHGPEASEDVAYMFLEIGTRFVNQDTSGVEGGHASVHKQSVLQVN